MLAFLKIVEEESRRTGHALVESGQIIKSAIRVKSSEWISEAFSIRSKKISFTTLFTCCTSDLKTILNHKYTIVIDQIKVTATFITFSINLSQAISDSGDERACQGGRKLIIGNAFTACGAHILEAILCGSEALIVGENEAIEA